MLQVFLNYGPFGSNGQTTWSMKLGKYARIKEVQINHGYIVDGIGFTVEYGSGLINTTTKYFGGQGGKTSKVTILSVFVFFHKKLTTVLNF